MPLTSQPLRILLVANDDEHARVMRGVMAASRLAQFQVEYASNGWAAQRQAADQTYAALVVEHSLSDTDAQTLLGRLKAIGVDAPALLLASGDDDDQNHAYLPRAEALTGNTLARAILAMIQRHDLTEQLAAARTDATRATTALSQLTHDLATPLGVVMGMTQVLLSEDIGLNPDDRSCLEDVSREALRACDILKRVSDGPQPRAPAPHVPAVARAIRSPSPGSKMVLIADDDAATRRLVCSTLASDQYSVLEAEDGKEAWRLIREHHPAVAILDWQMPIYSGLELTDVIKGDPQVQGMTVILLTGRSAQADRDAGARARADLYLIKPFSPKELLDAVEQALGIS